MGEVLSNYKTLFMQQSCSEREMLLGSVSFAMIATAGTLLADRSVKICVLVSISGELITTAAGLASVMRVGIATRR
jgi:hypothetical protein